MEGQSTAIMSEAYARRLEAIRQWARGLKGKVLPDGVDVDSNGVIQITTEASDDDLARMGRDLSEADLKTAKMGTTLKFYIARTVRELAARQDKPLAQVIDELGICDGTGRDINTVYSWCNALAQVPDECFHPNLTMTHYVRAIGVALPGKAEDAKKLRDKRVELLKAAALDPLEYSANTVGRELRAYRDQLGREYEIKQVDQTEQIRRRMLVCYRSLRLMDVRPDLFEAAGVTRADIVNRIESDEVQLIDRGHWSASEAALVREVAMDVLPADRQPVDVEGEEETNDQGI